MKLVQGPNAHHIKARPRSYLPHQTIMIRRLLGLLLLLIPTNGTTYSPEEANLLLTLSSAAYCPRAEIRSWSCKPCRDIAPFNTSLSFAQMPLVFNGVVGGFGTKKKPEWFGTQGYVAVIRDPQTGWGPWRKSGKTRIAVAFRGSANLTNWEEDFNIWETAPYYQDVCGPNCRVHRGFLNSWLSIGGKVAGAVRYMTQLYPDAEIVITGHSLGAAMAVHCATHLHVEEGLRVSEVITFGQPRCGNAAFADFFNSNITGNGDSSNNAAGGTGGANTTTWRVVNLDDPVPHLPPRWIAGDYTHVATEVWYNSTRDRLAYKVCDGTGEDPTCSDREKVVGDIVDHAKDHMQYLGRSWVGCA